MAQGDGFIYNSFKEAILEGLIDLASGGHTLKMSLHHGYTPDVDNHALWADVSGTEYGTGNGYTAGGTTLTGQDVTKDTGNDRAVFDADDVTFLSLGPLTPNPPGHAILRDSSVSGEMLICGWELGATMTNGGNYTLAFGLDGILELT